MRCSSCQHENPSEHRFCAGCGAALTRSCPACGCAARPEDAFCGACGAPLAANAGSAPAPSEERAERRQLTVAFCDLVDSTRLSAALDAEDWRELVRRYQGAAAGAIERFGGHVAQYLGDGILAYFGWPRAHEDDAERAVRAGLAIVDAVGGLAGALAVRVGIHTGPVVVGEMGGGKSRETLAMGETTNVAARLQALTDPGAVVFSAATLRLVQGLFVAEELGPQALKGIAAPLRAYRAVRASGVRSRLDLAAAAGLTPLVGREQEVGLLLDRWEQVREGAGQAVLIAGEAGIGKSRLVEAFRARLAESPHTWLECRCSPYTQDSALLPVVDLLTQALSALAPETARGARVSLEQLEQALAGVGFPLTESVPLMASFLSLPASERYPLPNLSPEGRRRKTLALLAEWLLRLGRQQPVVLLFEDLQWVDPSTQDLLGTILEQVPMASVLALYTHRPDFSVPWPPKSHVTPVLLPRLTRAQGRQMVEGAARGRRLPEAWAREIVRRTDGIPLFVEELTRTLLESAVLEQETDEAALEQVLDRLAIPATLQDSLAARLDALGPVKEVAQLAACLGRELSFELLLAVSPLKDSELEAMLARAVAAELFYQRGTPPEALYWFKHSLVQEAAYQSLLKSTRQRHHKRIAETLEQRFPEIVETRPELVAHHRTEAGETELAVGSWQRAGQRAIERSAHKEAVRHLGKSLDLLLTLPETLERSGRELGFQMLLGLGSAAAEGYGAPGAGRAFARAGQLCRELGESAALFPILFGQHVFYMVRADADAQRELAERLLALARRSGDPGLLVEGHLAMGQADYWAGELRASREHLEQVLALYDRERDRAHVFVYGQDPAAYAHAYLGFVVWQIGAPDQALVHALQAVALAEAIGHPFTLAGVAGGFAAVSRGDRGEFEQCVEVAERARSIAVEQGFPMWVGFTGLYASYAGALLDRSSDDLRQARDSLTAIRETGALISSTRSLCLLAEASLRAGQIDAGLAAADEALDHAEKHRERFWEPEIHRLRGELLRQDGADPPAVEACFQRALEIARGQQAKSLELRAAMSLARLWRDHGKRDEARALLQPVYAWFTEGFDTKDLRDAQALLAELGR